MIKLYSKPNCNRCEILKKKLKNANIEYQDVNTEEESSEELIKAGIQFLPVLDTDGQLLDYKKAVDYIRERSE